MRGLTWLLNAFLSPAGLLVLGVLDGSIFVATPFALDAAVIVLVARNRDTFWLYPVMATVGSALGTALTFWIGRKLGEAGLERFIARQRLDRTLTRVRETGAVAIALLDLIPPPFPFTPFVLVAGALDLSFTRFLIAVAATKLVRFGLEAALALFYGPQILVWIESDAAKAIGSAIAVLIVALLAFSIVKVWRQRRPRDPRPSQSPHPQP
jgi:membrane protein YqaA with SNARE-associated domain